MPAPAVDYFSKDYKTMRMSIKKLQFVIEPLIMLLLSVIVVLPQSGRSGMRGYVAFEDLSYIEVAERKVHARIELRGTSQFNHSVQTTETDEHGLYDFKSVSPGEYS